MKEDLNQTIILNKNDDESFLDFNTSIDLDCIIKLFNLKEE